MQRVMPRPKDSPKPKHLQMDSQKPKQRRSGKLTTILKLMATLTHLEIRKHSGSMKLMHSHLDSMKLTEKQRVIRWLTPKPMDLRRQKEKPTWKQMPTQMRSATDFLMETPKRMETGNLKH